MLVVGDHFPVAFGILPVHRQYGSGAMPVGHLGTLDG